jgi:hypothetical protein
MSGEDSGNLTPTANDHIASEQLLKTIDRPKRQFATAACQHCRKSKTKAGSFTVVELDGRLTASSSVTATDLAVLANAAVRNVCFWRKKTKHTRKQ